MQPVHCAVPVRRSPDVEFGLICFLIEYKHTAVASTRGSVGLSCLLLVSGSWRWLFRVDRWLLAGWSWGLAVPFSELALELGHVGLVG